MRPAMLPLLLIAPLLVLLAIAAGSLLRSRASGLDRGASAAELAEWLESLRQPVADGTDPFEPESAAATTAS